MKRRLRAGKGVQAQLLRLRSIDKQLHLVAGLLLLVILSHFDTAASVSLRTLVATVERVSDGDTIIALTSEGTKLRIRLLGIDAPEVPHGKKPGQPFVLGDVLGDVATLFTFCSSSEASPMRLA